MRIAIISVVALIAVIGVIFSVSGEGSFKRMVTVSGIYSVCKPEGYEVVCFLDADGTDGGVFCMPLKDAGGKCK